MAKKKSDIPYEQADALCKRVAAELGMSVEIKSAFLKVESRTGWKIYVMMSKRLGHIDTNLPIRGEPGTYPLDKHNGSISCHIDPDLGVLEGFLRRLVDPALGSHVTNRPRLGAIVRPPPARTPKPIVPPAPVERDPEYAGKHPDLVRTLKNLRDRARIARERRLMEERGIDPDLASIAAAGDVDEDDAAEASRNAREHELDKELFEAGIEVLP